MTSLNIDLFEKVLQMARRDQTPAEQMFVDRCLSNMSRVQKIMYNNRRQCFLKELEEKKMNYIKDDCGYISIGSCTYNIPTAPECAKVACAPVTTKKKEKTMFYDEDSGEYVSDEKLAYLKSRLSGTHSQKHEELFKQFGLRDDDAPRTVADLLKRIADGKYLVKEDDKNRDYYDPIRYIHWRDPSVKEDKEGFKAAEKVLYAAYTKAKDLIVVKSDEDARLKALNDFEAFTVQ